MVRIALVVGLSGMGISCNDPYLYDPADHRSMFANDLESGMIVRYTFLDNFTDFLLILNSESFVPSNLNEDFKTDALRVLFSYEETNKFHSCDPTGIIPVIRITYMEEVYR